MKQEFPHDYQFSKACNESSVSFELIADNGAVELLLDEGRISITQLYYPENPEGNISLSGQGWSQVKLATCKQDIN
ncbi:TPA: GH32 C-terminal domain-containing protein [Vibrio parahaemolyticus]|nr:GH32 C-terminal domain-containing protein [Vibrio parahaemolyticus]